MTSTPLHPPLPDLSAEAIQTLPRLTALLHRLPLAAALLLAALGLLALLWGSRYRRVLALVAGAGLGALAAHIGHPWIRAHVGLSGTTALVIGAAVVGVASALVPPLFVFAAGALPLALVGVRFPIHGEAALGLLAGAAVGGVAALLLSRFVAALAAAALGSALVAASLLAVSRRFPDLAFLSRHPIALAVLVAVLSIAGAAFQAQAGSGGRTAGARKPSKPPRSDATTVAE